MKTPVLTARVGTNAELISEVARLYLKKGMLVADVTYGRGAFWNFKIPFDICIHKTDLFPLKNPMVNPRDVMAVAGVEKADFRRLPYPSNSMDVVVLDPPYMHGGGTIKKSIAGCYGNNKSGDWSHKKIVELYSGGIVEASRVLKDGGQLWVKCQDEIESGKQKWSHIEILDDAHFAGFKSHDLFVLIQKTRPAQRQQKQHHARKNHSYLWVFVK